MNMVLNYLQYLGYILIFPGFLFCFVAGLLLCGIDRKLVARMQKRVGPPVLQPFYDFFKLCGKETIIPTAATKTTFLAAPIVGFAALVVIQLFIPIRGFTPFAVLGDIADVIVILYLLLIPAIATIMGGAASGSPYAGVGLSREMVTIISCELPLVLVLLAIPIGLPLVFGAGATVLGVLLAIVVTVLAVIFAVLLILYGIPLALICGGAVIALLSCTLWATPANALVTLGNGLAAFAAGKDYAAWLQASAAALAETMGESGTLYARTADLPLLQGKLPAGVALTADDTITLGGLRAANPATGLAADDTLEARLDAQHDWFLQNAGLEITI